MSQLVRRQSHSNSFSINNVNTKNLSLMTSADLLKSNQLLKERSTNLVPGFAYSILDSFENESFNMVYVLKRTEQDIKVILLYINI